MWGPCGSGEHTWARGGVLGQGNPMRPSRPADGPGRLPGHGTPHTRPRRGLPSYCSSYSLVKCETVNEWDWESCLLVKKKACSHRSSELEVFADRTVPFPRRSG